MALSNSAGVIDAAQLSEQVGTDSGKQVIRVERGLLHQVSESTEPSLGAAGLPDCESAIQFDHRRRCQREQGVVQGDDAFPIGVLIRPRGGIARGDSGLDAIAPNSQTPFDSMNRDSYQPTPMFWFVFGHK